MTRRKLVLSAEMKTYLPIKMYLFRCVAFTSIHLTLRKHWSDTFLNDTPLQWESDEDVMLSVKNIKSLINERHRIGLCLCQHVICLSYMSKCNDT